MTDPLQLPLKDIHLPQAISWWPPAPGWWILLALIVFATALAYWWYRHRQLKKLSAVSMALQELELLQSEYDTHHDARRFIADLSVLLRRLSISAFPRSESASLTGEQWLQFLDGSLPNAPFSKGAGRILMDAPYRPAVKDEELSPLLEVCRQWIEQVAHGKAGQSI